MDAGTDAVDVLCGRGELIEIEFASTYSVHLYLGITCILNRPQLMG